MSLQAAAVRKVLNTSALVGMGDSKTYNDYMGQLNLLGQQEPPVANPFPPCWKKAMHSTGANLAHSAADFWVFLADEKLYQFLESSDEVEAMQLELLAGRILTSTQTRGDEVALNKLQDLAVAFHSHEYRACTTGRKLASEMWQLALFVCPGQ
eukprot:3517639-Lingulodinium_polyedra.AAC.1